MKKISNVEVRVINLNANDVIATSVGSLNAAFYSEEATLVNSRGYYDYYEDEEEW